MKEFVALRAKPYSYLTNSNNSEDRKTKDTKICVINLHLKIIKTV